MKLTRPSLIAVALALGLIAGCGSNADRALPVSTTSDKALSLYRQGMFAIDEGLRDSAHALFSAAVELDSTFALAWLRLAAVYRERRWEYLERAKAQFGRISAGEETAILADEAAWRGDRRLHDSLIAVVAEGHPGDYRYCQYMGNTLSTLHRHDSARVWYQRAIDANPEFPRAYNDLGYSLFMLNDDSSAATAFARYAALAPRSAAAQFALGDFRLAIRDYPSAIRAFDSAVALDPDRAQTRFGLIFAHMYRDDPVSAVGSLNAWRSESPERAVDQLYGAALLSLYNGQLDSALTALYLRTQSALNAGDQLTAYHSLLEVAHLLALLGNVAGAEAALNDAWAAMTAAVPSADERVKFVPDHLIAACEHEALRGNSGLAEARAFELVDYVDTLKNPVDRERYHDLLGMLGLTREKYETALTELEMGSLDSPMNTYRRGLAYLGLGETGRAREMFVRSARLVTYDLLYILTRYQSDRRVEAITELHSAAETDSAQGR
ncbi:MAG TPA: tetratricopeptide repeat protein [candidate division Zixibacteria bacterium]|nr:tetratricopeptide repeat protein [candidate division Zixibacteria bacterium]